MADADLAFLRGLEAETLDPDEPPEGSGFTFVAYNYDDYEESEREDNYMLVWRKGARFFGCHLTTEPPIELAYAGEWREVFPWPRIKWGWYGSRLKASSAIAHCTDTIVEGLSAPSDFVY